MIKNELGNTIHNIFRTKEIMKDIGKNDDFFDLGVSSLMVVELQIMIEKELGFSVTTAKLMAVSTIQEWIDLFYAASKSELYDIKRV